MRGESLKEQAAVGLAQAQNIGRLRKTAEETGHHLGLYYTNPLCNAGEEPERATYIHSKLMIVDDRLMLVGSANLTNLSMGVDTQRLQRVVLDGAAVALAASAVWAREGCGNFPRFAPAVCARSELGAPAVGVARISGDHGGRDSRHVGSSAGGRGARGGLTVAP